MDPQTFSDRDAEADVEELFARGQWWHQEDPHELVIQLAEAIDRDAGFSNRIIHCLSLWSGRAVAGTTPDKHAEVADSALFSKGSDQVGAGYLGAPQTATNVVRRIVSTLVAEAAQNRPRPMFLTDGGSYALQEAAKKMTRFADGCFSESDADGCIKRCARNSLIFPKGIAKIFAEAGRVRVEAIFPGYVLVDDQDAINGKPRSMYQRAYVDRGKLIAEYPDKRREIATAPRAADSTGVGYRSASDQVCVIEGWHLPSLAKNTTTDEPASKDGRHVICIDGATLFDEPWEDDDFPFAFLDWETPPIGFWGISIAEILTPIQWRLVDLEDRITKCQELAALRIFVPKGSKVIPSHLEGIDGTIVSYEGSIPPTFNTATVVPPELYQERERLIKQAFDECGVSEMASQALKPAGLDSGTALRTYIDHQSKRFLDWTQGIEKFAVDIAKRMIDCVRRLAKDDPDYEVVYRSADGIERIKWSDIDLDRDAYRIDVPPVSALPSTPAGRLSMLMDMLQNGMTQAMGWDADTIRSLMNFPDLAAVQPTTPRDSAKADIAAILDRGQYIPPEEFQDLKVCVQVAQETYLDVRRKGASQDVKDLLLQYIDAAQDLFEQAAAKAAPPPMVAPPMGSLGSPPMPAPMLPPALVAAA